MSLANPPKALLTDVFGTVVDWRLTVTQTLTTAALAALTNPTNISSISPTIRATASTTNWGSFAQAWREAYFRFTSSYDPSSSTNFTTIDAFFRSSLAELLTAHSLNGLWTDTELDRIAHIWYTLAPWADSRPGIALLSTKFQTATLSNGNTALLTSLADHANLRYTHILSAEHFGAYKPNPRVYLGAAERLGLRPEECAMVAAHLGDLAAARRCGFQTIYIERAEEEGWDTERAAEARTDGSVDMWVGVDEGGFLEVARRFGIDGGSASSSL